MEKRIAELENQIKLLEARIRALESAGMRYGQPLQPNNPWQPPYKITCKLADGTIKEMVLDSPIVAAGAEIHAGDGGYQIGTQEAYDAFVAIRNQSLKIE